MAREHQVVGEIVAIPVMAIAVKDRLRPIDPVWAAALGSMIAVDGQRTPIEVCRLPGDKGYLLVSGGHRLEGAIFAAIPTVNAIIVDNNALERRSREVSENLWRKDLGPLDRAATVAELYAIRKAIDGLAPTQDAHAAVGAFRGPKDLKEDAKQASDTVSLAFGWSEGVAEQVGLSRRTVYRDLALHRRLLPDVVELIRDHPVAASQGQLKALTKLTDEEQRAVAKAVVSGEAKTPAAAVKAMRGWKPPEDNQDLYYGRQITLWSRFTAKTKRKVLAEIIARDRDLPRDLKAFLAPLSEAGKAP